ncbi:hypothetical protein DPMN_034429 [Dreissena polymorpha]|uniref:Uncharacterized protein n=1 Tax=Dreissena polymorpha TaxID=45954 RepID=A0A9D4M5P9_DREPO|nr:hypothetical protein DPMN_034429 [Dreissena polymorpha]
MIACCLHNLATILVDAALLRDTVDGAGATAVLPSLAQGLGVTRGIMRDTGVGFVAELHGRTVRTVHLQREQ